MLVFRANQATYRRRFSTSAPVEAVFNYLLSEGLHPDQVSVRRHDNVELKKDERTLEQQGILHPECFYVRNVKKQWDRDFFNLTPTTILTSNQWILTQNFVLLFYKNWPKFQTSVCKWEFSINANLKCVKYIDLVDDVLLCNIQ